jgi:hypothetical protein
VYINHPAVVGATGATLVIFILPGIFYYTIHKINVVPRCGSDSIDMSDNFTNGRRHTHSYVTTATNPMNSSRSITHEDAVTQDVESGLVIPSLSGSWKTSAALVMFLIGIIIGPLSLFLIFYS